MTADVDGRPITVAVIGGGQRGAAYAKYALQNPSRMKVVAVAEPVDIKRHRLAKQHDIPPENVLAARPRFCDAVMICTLDHMHIDPAIAFANLKYDILLEKPMAVDIQSCLQIVEAVKRNGVLLAIGHVLHHTLLNERIKAIIDSGVLGKVNNIQHLEPVGFWHFAHSFVRGNWAREADCSFSLMTKSCHDIDLVSWFMNRKCEKISSFGSLYHFNKANKPGEAGSATRCLDCAFAPECPYDAKKIYIDRLYAGKTGWPVDVVTPAADIESLTEALKTGPYGRCVYESDNDVVDQQVVNMEFEDGATVSFSMIATTEALCQRKTRVFGSHGQLEADAETGVISHFDFLTRARTIIEPYAEAGIDVTTVEGHGGGDIGLAAQFVDAVKKLPNALPTPDETLLSHIYVFAAEEARKTNSVVNVQEYVSQAMKLPTVN